MMDLAGLSDVGSNAGWGWEKKSRKTSVEKKMDFGWKIIDFPEFPMLQSMIQFVEATHETQKPNPSSPTFL